MDIDSRHLEPEYGEEDALDAQIDSSDRDYEDDTPSYYMDSDIEKDAHPSNPYLVRTVLPMYIPLPQDSELRKPWREMNPFFAIEEAKLLPLPVRKWTMTAEGIAHEAAKKGYAPGTPEYVALENMINRPMVEHHPLFTRCPLCRSGTLKTRNGNFRTCPCCNGFIMVPESSIIGYMTSLNELTETQRIDKQTKVLVKERKNKRKAVKADKKTLTKKEKDIKRQQDIKANGIWSE